MTILIVLVTTILILDCLLLALLVLVQLPKKDAGVGMAFGGGAADALFGSGSGTALSNLTKYTATAFFVLVFVLSIMFNHDKKSGVSELKRQLERQSVTPASPAPATPANPSPSAGNSSAIPLIINTNTVPATSAPASNPPPATPK